MSEPVRIDKWLWAARFFKTRGKARAAIQGGKVHLNGNRVKPGRILQPGDRLRVQRGVEEFEVTVERVDSRRGSASEAHRLFTEDEESRVRRAAEAERRALQRQANAERERRPDKRERRQIIRFRQKPD